MPPLSRSARPLLTRVGGKPHATQDDHIDSLPTPPPSSSTRSSMSKHSSKLDEGDIYADPVSSSDEAPEPLPGKKEKVVHEFKAPRQLDTTRNTRPQRVSGFKAPPTFNPSPESLGSKRSNDEDSDPDTAIFSSQGSQKRLKKPTFQNCHARPAKAAYGKEARAMREIKAAKAKSLSLPKSTKPEAPRIRNVPAFVLPKGYDMFEFGAAKPDQQWRASIDAPSLDTVHDVLSDSSLSPGRSDFDVEEVEALDLRPPKPYVPVIKCSICHKDVDRFLREEFGDEFTPGQQLSYKWQQRFCTFHKQHEGRVVWKEKGYPDIDWERLERRMRKYQAHLVAVLDGREPSNHRLQLQQRLKDGSKTAVQVYGSEEAKPTVRVGYYGPRGEKLMTEYIVSSLGDEIRTQAARDRLVAAAGVSGGVSGFVQAVLVPELAEQLVMSDLHVSQEKAREIVFESAELGDLLNPEVEEKVAEIVELDE